MAGVLAAALPVVGLAALTPAAHAAQTTITLPVGYADYLGRAINPSTGFNTSLTSASSYFPSGSLGSETVTGKITTDAATNGTGRNYYLQNYTYTTTTPQANVLRVDSLKDQDSNLWMYCPGGWPGAAGTWTPTTCSGMPEGTFTYTFSHPVINPVVTLPNSAMGTSSVAGGSTDPYGIQWFRRQFVAINGVAPKTDQITAMDVSTALYPGSNPTTQWNQSTATWNHVFNTTTNWPPGPSYWSSLQVNGKVSSITLRLDPFIMSTRTITAGTLTGGPEGSFALFGARTDLQITKTAPATAAPGQTVNYQIKVTNAAGSADSHGFVLTDAIPAGLTNPQLVGAPAGCTIAGVNVECGRAPSGWSISPDQTAPANYVANLTGGDPQQSVDSVLAAGSTFTLNVAATVPANAAVGSTITNTAYVYGVDDDPNTANNKATVTTTVQAPQFTTLKSVAAINGAAVTAGTFPAVKAGDRITYQIKTSNGGSAGSTTLTETIPTGTTYVGDVADAAWSCAGGTSAGKQCTFTQSVAGAGSTTSRFTVKVDAPLASAVTEITNTVVSSADPGCTTGCTTTDPVKRWTLSKTAAVNRAGGNPDAGTDHADIGDTVTYTVTATNTTPASAPNGNVSGVVITDDLSGVLGSSAAAYVPGSAVLKVDGVVTGSATVAGTTLSTSAFALAAGKSATLTYQVRVLKGGVTLTNVVTGAGGAGGDTPPERCVTGAIPADTRCSTTTPVYLDLNVQKKGKDAAGAVVDVAGASFRILEDDGGQPAAATIPGNVVGQLASVTSSTGLYRLQGLAPGKVYWLDETAAPAGFNLLAKPVKLTVGPTGAVLLGSGNPQASLTVDGTTNTTTITVRDVKISSLPFTGSGAYRLGAGGVILLVVAAGGVLVVRRRRHVAAHRA